MTATKKVTFQRLPANARTMGDQEYTVKSLQGLTKITVGPATKAERVLKVGDNLSQKELDKFSESRNITVVVQAP